MRWSVKVTFEEAQVHLALEMKRQRSDRAIARTPLVLLVVFLPVTALYDFAMNPVHSSPQPKRAWWTFRVVTPGAGSEASRLMHTAHSKFILALQVRRSWQLPVAVTAWYYKAELTSAARLAWVRRHLWRGRYSVNFAVEPKCV
jgi:hypothetical protein